MLSLLTVSINEKKDVAQKVYVPIELEIVAVEVPKKVAVKRKKVVSKKAYASTKKAVKPTSMPGDRNQPIVKSSVAPVYPKKALNNDWEGTVKVKILVNAFGKVDSVQLIKSSGYDVLDQAYIRSVKLGAYNPKRIMGKNIQGSIIESYTFRLSGG